ncbi:phage gp6-like head-tail connector protein [Embleya hyalina]|uniref:Phage gp6-like head-tail connector protein n=1 Tax=Embleya hyalina TaxID=516124 RepID=A0A401YZ36_9ACTN|nr:phage gp6-like head-tail connector protein [Embleya hyalina]GCD99857.1 hypothetical protein EHYA_07579 [Embleya hyalina]
MSVSVDDVAARLGRPVTDEERPRIGAFLVDALAFVEDYTGRDFQRREHESFTVSAGPDPQISLPIRYLHELAIESVRRTDGTELLGYTFDGTSLWRSGGWGSTAQVRVTGTWGYSTIPAVVRATVCAEVIRWLAISPGIVSERVGEVEVEFGSSSSVQSLSASARTSLRGYRRRFASLSVRRSYVPLHVGGPPGAPRY